MPNPETPETPSLVQWAWTLVQSGALSKSAFNRADAQCLADAHWLCGHGLDFALIVQRMNTEPLSGALGFKTQRARIEEASLPAKPRGRRSGASPARRKASSGGRPPSNSKRYQPGADTGVQ